MYSSNYASKFKVKDSLRIGHEIKVYVAWNVLLKKWMYMSWSYCLYNHANIYALHIIKLACLRNIHTLKISMLTEICKLKFIFHSYDYIKRFFPFFFGETLKLISAILENDVDVFQVFHYKSQLDFIYWKEV